MKRDFKIKDDINPKKKVRKNNIKNRKKVDDSDSDSDSDYSIYSDEVDINDDISVNSSLTKSIIKNILHDIKLKNLYSKNSLLIYFDEKENEFETEQSNNSISNIGASLARKITLTIFDDIIFEYNNYPTMDIIQYLEDKILDIDSLKKKEDNLILRLSINPEKMISQNDSNHKDVEKYDDKFDNKFKEFLKKGMNDREDDLSYFRNLKGKEKEKYLSYIDEIKKTINNDSKPKLLQIIESKNTINNKTIILNKLQRFDKLSPFSGGYFKLKKWVDGVIDIPFGIYKNPPISKNSSKSKIKKYLKNVRSKLDDAVYGHEIAKKQILQIIAQTIKNPKEGGTIIAIQGPPGVGKTQLIQDGISKALDRPFQFISLGGATDSSFLEGHDYTYEGSNPGIIVDILKKSKCMNPVIFFDELDKVSQTQKGEEIINILTHLTDSTQNSHFNDKYYSGIDFDLSKCIFIFSFNDEWKINRILKDRMYIIRTKGFQINEKIKIAKNYMIPKLLNSVGFSENKIKFSNKILEFIIENYTFEGGVRRLKECILEIIKEINLRELDGTKLLDKSIKLPLDLNIKMLKDDIFKKRIIRTVDKIHEIPKVGLVNGLWANDLGVGGLIPIEAFSIPTVNKLQLELTGMQGDVMKESMRVAKTVAWNILPKKAKHRINQSWIDYGYSGIHIHCPDGSTPKDGPSAGAAITTAILSLLLNKKVNNKIAMTGEINLKGGITRIGGLSEKLIGAKKAGAEIVLIPKGNEKDLNKIILSENNPIDSTFKVITVTNIWEVLKLSFTKSVRLRIF